MRHRGQGRLQVVKWAIESRLLAAGAVRRMSFVRCSRHAVHVFLCVLKGELCFQDSNISAKAPWDCQVDASVRNVRPMDSV